MRPTEGPADPWAEGPSVHRLSTRVPGLGNATGLIVPTAFPRGCGWTQAPTP